MLSYAVAMFLAAGVGGASAGCYAVYDGAGKAVSRSSDAPVDLSRPIGDTVRERFGAGSHMVMGSRDDDCPALRGAHEKPFDGAGWDKVQRGSVASVAEAHVSSAPRSVAPYFGGGAGGAYGYPHVGPRGGHYKITSGGHKSYKGRGR